MVEVAEVIGVVSEVIGVAVVSVPDVTAADVA